MIEEDSLEKFDQESTDLNPAYPEMVAAVMRRRDLISDLAKKRRMAKLSQKEVANAMSTSQSTIARLETSEANPSLLTLEKYAYAIGCRIEFNLVPIPETSDAKKEVSRAG